jgi:ABC-type multidrug transport system fused ATPase/permease subunit
MFLGSFVSGGVALGVVLSASSIGSTVAGLVLLYAMSFTEAVTYLARQHGDCQMMMNSVERLIEYCNLEIEAYESKKASMVPPSDRKSNVGGTHTRHHPHLDVESSDELMQEKGQWTGWPLAGSIEFHQIEIKYRPSDPSVLK